MPIFIYALPVTATSAVLVSLTALAVERPSFVGVGKHGIMGYFASHHWVWVVYLAVVPGLVGHTGFNTLLRFFSPLVISMALPMEPIVGSMIGYDLGLTKAPGVLTWVGGAIVVSALMYNTYCESARSATRKKKAAVNQATSETLNDNDAVELASFTIADEGDAEEFFVDET
jgi:drug/metabolite transporter (DMT)-like permease